MLKGKKTILIVTPGLNGLGGVANYWKTILPLLKENEEFQIEFLETGSSKGQGNRFYPILDQLNFHHHIKNIKPSLIHINPSLDPKSFIRDGVLIYQAVRKKIPVVVFFHGWDPSFSQIVEKYFLWFFKATFGRADAFIVLASEFKNELLEWNLPAPIFIETTALDPALINNFKIANKIEDLRNRKSSRILYLARIERAKGIFETVDAIKLLIDKNIPVKLSIAGDGPGMQELTDYVNSLHFSSGVVNFLGYVRGEAKTAAFENNEIYCFPTYYREGLPISVLEALAFGMPVITCAVGGLADIFKDSEMGTFVPLRDPEAIAGAIDQMIGNREAMARIAEYNHAYAKEKFLAPRVAMRLLRIYKKTLDFYNDSPNQCDA
jgi:glycosyltransferase involved in cell wall biosynthesis